MNSSKFFRSCELYKGVTAILGQIGEYAFLVCRKDKAILIDTLTGIGSLKAYCRELTDLPLNVVNTHSHEDHVGGNTEFKCCYIHPYDMESMYHYMSREKRVMFLEKYIDKLSSKGILLDDLIDDKEFFSIPIFDREYFDLGGKIIEIIHIPGHSRGSIALLDVDERTVFIGDSISSKTFLVFENSVSIEEYGDMLNSFKLHQYRFDRMIGSHSTNFLAPIYIDEAIVLCQEILEGRDDSIPYPIHPFYLAKEVNINLSRKDGKYVNICYDKMRVFKQDSPKEIIPYKNRKFNEYD